MDENFGIKHQAFLQACARFGVMTPNQSLEILKTVQAKYGNVNDEVNDAAVRKLVDEINAKFLENEVDQRINFVHYEWDNLSIEFLVFCCTFATTGPSSIYNESECIFMKNIMERIVMSETHSIEVMYAIQLCSLLSQPSQSQSTMKRVTKQRAEELLEEWENMGYFMTTNENITLGPRCIGEFRDTFRSKFGDYIQSCQLCNELVLQPKFCPNDECDAVLDKRCFSSWVEKKKKCPACKVDWIE